MIRQFSIRSFIQQNYLLFLLLACIIGLLYSNSLNNEFAVVDDLQGIVENPLTKDLEGSMRSFRLQHLMNAFNYSLFGMNPLPFRIITLFIHFFVCVLLALILNALFGRKVSWLGTLLFAIHPVNAESINWISAQLYSIHALFAYGAVLLYLIYRSTSHIRYLVASAIIIIVELVLIRHPWVLVVPFIITTFDLFWREKRFAWKPLLTFWGILIPAFMFFLIMAFARDVDNRLAYRQEGGNRTLVNQQSLTPILVSYPYTIGTMTRLYLYPKTLTIYYDGNKLTHLDYLFMYAVTLLYIGALIYFFKKDRRVCTILLILLVALAPSFSPVKVTWYITERYLYLGSGFFVGLLAYLLTTIEHKTKIKYLAAGLTLIIALLFSLRTYQRNNDWNNPETLARATMSSSPLSVRGYNDLGGYYVIQGRYEDAKKYYQQALQISPSGTAIHNLGYIYIQTGMDPSVHTTDASFDELYSLGIASLEQKDLRAAMYYFNEALSLDPQSSLLHSYIGYVLAEYEMYDRAVKHLQRAQELDATNPQALYFLGYVAYKTGDVGEAITYLEETLVLKPDHAEAKANLEYLKGSPIPSQESPE